MMGVQSQRRVRPWWRGGTRPWQMQFVDSSFGFGVLILQCLIRDAGWWWRWLWILISRWQVSCGCGIYEPGRFVRGVHERTERETTRCAESKVWCVMRWKKMESFLWALWVVQCGEICHQNLPSCFSERFFRHLFSDIWFHHCTEFLRKSCDEISFMSSRIIAKEADNQRYLSDHRRYPAQWTWQGAQTAGHVVIYLWVHHIGAK